MKRKRFDRRGWTWIGETRYTQTRVETPDFHGTLALVEFITVEKPTFWGDLRVIDAGLCWLEYAEDGCDCFVSAMCDGKGGIYHWYIDIIDGLHTEPDGVGLFDDLYLDLEVYSDGSVRILDRDELDEALEDGDITEEQHKKALAALERTLGETSDFDAFTAKCKNLYNIIIENKERV